VFLHRHPPVFSSPARLLEALQCRTAWARWCGELRLHEDLLHVIFPLVEHVVDLLQILDCYSVGDHLQRVDFAGFDHAKELLPVHVDWTLTVPYESNASLHQGAHVEVVGLSCVSQRGQLRRLSKTYVADINASNAASTKVLNRGDHLVQELRSVCLHAQEHLEVVCPALSIFSCSTLECNIRTAVNHLLERRGDGFALGEIAEVKSLDLRILGLHVVESPVGIYHDDTGGAVHERELSTHLTDRSSTPYGYYIALGHTGINNAVP
jgi:hypothetical protein